MGKAGMRVRSNGRGAEGPYRPDIDGLRAVAVLSVLFFHARFTGFSGGFVGVDVFFVISGFLIGGHIYAEEREGRFSFLSFYRRRAKRILPALYAVVVAVLILGILFLSPLELRRSATESLATLGFASNVFFWKASNYFAVESSQRMLLMTWSLGVEEQFYFFVPVLIVILMRKKIRLEPVLILIALSSLGLAAYQVTRTPLTAFYLIPGRAWELLAGMLAALFVERRRPFERGGLAEAAAGFGVLLIASSIALLSNQTSFPGFAAIPSVLGTALLVCTPGAAVNRRVMALRPLRFVGKISYSLYLWHWPLLTLLRILLGRALSRREAGLVLLLAFGCAYASFRWIEQPFRRSGTPALRVLGRYALVTAALAAVCLDIRLSYGWEWRAPALATEEKMATPRTDGCLVEAEVAAPDLSASCVEDTGRSAMALWGDSHAAALASAVRDEAHAKGYDFVQLTKSSCPPLAGVGRYLHGSPHFARDCLDYNASVLEFLMSHPRIQAAVLAGDWKASFLDPAEKGTGWLVLGGAGESVQPSAAETERIFAAGLQRSAEKLRAGGRAVWIVQDVPEFQRDPLWRVRTAALPARRAVWGLFSSQAADPGVAAEAEGGADRDVRRIVRGVATQISVRILDPHTSLCPGGQMCQYRSGTRLWYEDQQHLTPTGAAAALAPWLTAADRATREEPQ